MDHYLSYGVSTTVRLYIHKNVSNTKFWHSVLQTKSHPDIESLFWQLEPSIATPHTQLGIDRFLGVTLDLKDNISFVMDQAESSNI